MPWEQYQDDAKPWEKFSSPAPKEGVKPKEKTKMVETPNLLQTLDLTPPKEIYGSRAVKGKYQTYNEDVKATVDPQYKAQSKKVTETLRKASDVSIDTNALYSKFHTTMRDIKSMFNDDVYDMDGEDRLALEQAGWSEIEKDGEGFSGYVNGELKTVKLSDIVTAEKDKVSQAVVEELDAQGFKDVKSVNGQLSINIDGMDLTVDGDMMRDLWAHKYEIAAGTVAGTAATLAAPSFLAATTAGAVATGLASAGGAYLDSIANRIDMVNDVDEKIIKDKVMDAGIYGAITNVIGDAAFYSMKYPFKWSKQLYDNVMDGNLDGAYRHALNHYGVTEEQAREIVQKMEALTGEMKGTDKEKALEALTVSRPGGEAVVNVANLFNPGASSNVANQVIKRADDLLGATKKLTAENAPNMVKRELDVYVQEVGDYYGQVKQAGSELTPDYKFSFDNTAIQPIVEQIGKNIEDPIIKQRYADILTRIDDATTDRSFNALIDLREQLNKMKYAAKSVSTPQKQALDASIKSIDNEIDKVAKDIMPDGQVWKEHWTQAKQQYAKMKELEDNVLYQAITKAGNSPDDVIKAMSKYIRATDDTFIKVMEKLPKGVRTRAEGAIINEMVEKYAIGQVGGHRAIHFPMLAKELGKVKWSSPKTIQLARTVDRMAEVFQNDVNLARVAGRIEVPKFQSYLTTDPIIRLKYEIASNIFNYIKQLKPGDQADATALVKNTGNLLENPLNTKTIDEIKRGLPKDQREFRARLSFDETLNELRQLYIQKQEAWKAFNKPQPAKLTWKTPRENAQQVLKAADEMLYATERGTVSTNPSSAVLKDRSDDLIQEFLYHSTNKSPDEIVSKVSSYITSSGKKLDDVLKRTRAQLIAGEKEANARVVAKTIQYEAKQLQKAIERDFGIQFPTSEAEKFVKLKFKEYFNDCMR